MESELCMICSNILTKEEELFRPCECSLKYCFFCFKDLFEKLSGARQGACPQCSKPVQARIEIPKSTRPNLDISNRAQLKKIRIINRKSLYIQHIPSALPLSTLESDKYLKKYGAFTHLSIDLKYFPSDPPSTYRVFAHYLSETSALKAILALNGHKIGTIQLRAEYMVANFCGNFIRNKPCAIRDCKFLHGVDAGLEWMTVEELKRIDLSKAEGVERVEIDNCGDSEFPNVSFVEKKKAFENVFVPKRSVKYLPKYIPVSGMSFKGTEETEGKKAEYKELIMRNTGKNTKGGVFQLLSEGDE